MIELNYMQRHSIQEHMQASRGNLLYSLKSGGYLAQLQQLDIVTCFIHVL